PSAVFGRDMDLGEIVITASRMEQQADAVSSDITVITPEDLAQSPSRSMSEVMEEKAGIFMYEPGTALKVSTIDIRGFGDTAKNNILFLLNGRKMNSIDNSGFDPMQIPLEAIDRVEITRGAGSVLYGDNAVGGVVNIITKKEGEGKISGALGVNHGSYNTTSEDLTVSGRRGPLSYFLLTKYFDTKGYRSNGDLLYKDFVNTVGYRFSEDISVTVNTSWHEDDYGMPGGLNEEELQRLGRRGSADEENYASTKDRNFQLSWDWAPPVDGWARGNAIVDFNYRNRDTYAMLTSEFGDFATKRGIDSYGINARYVLGSLEEDLPWKGVFGLDYYDVDNDILGSAGNSDDLTISKRELGYYVSAEYGLTDKMFLLAGTRYQKAHYTFDQKSGTPFYENQRPDESVSQIGGRYEYAPGSNVNVSVQQTFRFPSTDEWYSSFSGLNTSLDPQTGLQYEVGIRHDFDRVLQLDATAYVMDIKHELFYDPSIFANENYDSTRRVGLELGQTVNMLHWVEDDTVEQWDIFMNYTYQNATFKDGSYASKQIPWVPVYQFNAGTRLKFWKSWGVSLTGRYVGSRYAINDVANATTPGKPYIVVDTKVSWSKDPVEIFLSLNNLFNERYNTYIVKSSFSDTKDYYPAAERNVLVGMKLSF
ncbi:MAG TPA: TonB-dependent receptor, partial [Candidatus Omnitrophota bacterium]|nr:TonB-dependent receptor [Candidatus Omnitrophota bacterium]